METVVIGLAAGLASALTLFSGFGLGTVCLLYTSSAARLRLQHSLSRRHQHPNPAGNGGGAAVMRYRAILQAQRSRRNLSQQAMQRAHRPVSYTHLIHNPQSG